jgi:hypothetical protein
MLKKSKIPPTVAAGTNKRLITGIADIATHAGPKPIIYPKLDLRNVFFAARL